jgi:hypothetical protein
MRLTLRSIATVAPPSHRMAAVMRRPRSRFLRKAVEPFAVAPGLPVDDALARMERVSFQGRTLATSSIGTGLSQARHRDPGAGIVDVIDEIIASAGDVLARRRYPKFEVSVRVLAVNGQPLPENRYQEF